MNTSSVTQKGQVTIPIEFRRFLGLEKNSRVSFEKKGDKVLIHKDEDIMDLAGFIKPKKGRGMDSVKTREYIENHYERI